MKKILFLIIIGLPLAAKADCYSIRDTDLKNNCLAEQKKEAFYCYSVQDADMKNYCLAKVKQEKVYCYSLKNQDKKNECLAIVK